MEPTSTGAALPHPTNPTPTVPIQDVAAPAPAKQPAETVAVAAAPQENLSPGDLPKLDDLPVAKPSKQPKPPKRRREPKDHASAAGVIVAACVFAFAIAGIMVYAYLRTQQIALF